MLKSKYCITIKNTNGPENILIKHKHKIKIQKFITEVFYVNFYKTKKKLLFENRKKIGRNQLSSILSILALARVFDGFSGPKNEKIIFKKKIKILPSAIFSSEASF